MEVNSDKYDSLVCPKCGGCKCHTCICPGGARGPKLHAGINDKQYEDNTENN